MTSSLSINILIISMVILSVGSAQMNIYQSYGQPGMDSGGSGSVGSFTEDEGLTPASGHYNPRNIKMFQNAENNFAVEIPNSLADSGQVRSDGVVNSYANAGSALRAESAAFITFDISSIPKEATIEDVSLTFEGFDIVGQPFSSLGCLNVYPASYRLLASQSYSIPSSGPYLEICSQSELYSAIRSPYLTTAVRAGLGSGKLQLRLQFDREGSGGQQESRTVTTYTTGGEGYGYGGDYLLTPYYGEETEYYSGFDQAYLLSESGESSKVGNYGYIVVSPTANLSEIGVTQEAIEDAMGLGKVRVAHQYNQAERTIESFNGTWGSEEIIPSEQTPKVISQTYRVETQKAQNLIKSGVIWLKIIYSMPQQPKKPNMGDSSFKLPEYLIEWNNATCGDVPPNQVLVVVDRRLGFRDAGTVASNLAAELNGNVVGYFQYLNLFQIETPSLTRDQLMQDILYARNYGYIDLAFPNYQLCHETISPLDDEVYQGDSGNDYEIIGVQDGWDLISYSKVNLSEVHVGITDDGIYKGFGEFNNADINTSMKVCPEAPSALLQKPLHDYEIAGSHGTGIMNLLAADEDDGGLVGIMSPAISSNKKIKFDVICIYVEDRAFITTSLLGLKAEIENGCTILSCSWGNSYADEDATEMYELLLTNLSRDYPELLFIFSAGNDGIEIDGNIRIPNGLPKGPLPNVITVGNIMNDGQICESSNRNKNNQFVTMAAPGEQAVWGRDNRGNIINEYGGTSMAVPQVAAAAALVKSICTELSAGDIKSMLIDSAQDDINGLEAPPELGGHIIAIDNAVKMAIDKRQERDAQSQQGNVPNDNYNAGANAIESGDTSKRKPIIELPQGIEGETSRKRSSISNAEFSMPSMSNR